MFLHGCNYPWSTDGTSVYYGMDFGANVWGSHAGVSTRRPQIAADFVLPAESLSSIIVSHSTAVRAARIVRQNLTFAAIYNLVLIPVAVLGFASPLIAAAAMSASSIIVTLNALRAQPARIRATP